MIRQWTRLTWARLVELRGFIRSDRPLYRFGVTLLTVDLVATAWWAGTRLLYNLDITQDLYEIKFLRIDADGGIPEWFNYAKTLFLVCLLVRLYVSKRQMIHAALAALFALVLADDMLEIHESGGKYFARALELRPWQGLRSVDFGELITWGLLGLLILPLLLIGLMRSERSAVVDGLVLLVPVGALVFFGAFIDQLYHVMRDAFFGADIVLGGLEDGGEMVAITLACVLAAAMLRQAHRVTVESLPRR